jgi:ComF family protein
MAYYEPTLKEAIHLLKYQKKEIMAKPLAKLVLTLLPTLICIRDYDCIMPIPLHKNRQRDRGYNQVQLIVSRLKDDIKLPVEKKALIRIKETKPQSLLETVNQKIENVKDAFVIRTPEAIRSKKILLVDDIFTTGATVSEATKALLKAGASRVDVLTLARARFNLYSSC